MHALIRLELGPQRCVELALSTPAAPVADVPIVPGPAAQMCRHRFSHVIHDRSSAAIWADLDAARRMGRVPWRPRPAPEAAFAGVTQLLYAGLPTSPLSAPPSESTVIITTHELV